MGWPFDEIASVVDVVADVATDVVGTVAETVEDVASVATDVVTTAASAAADVAEFAAPFAGLIGTAVGGPLGGMVGGAVGNLLQGENPFDIVDIAAAALGGSGLEGLAGTLLGGDLGSLATSVLGGDLGGLATTALGALGGGGELGAIAGLLGGDVGALAQSVLGGDLGPLASQFLGGGMGGVASSILGGGDFGQIADTALGALAGGDLGAVLGALGGLGGGDAAGVFGAVESALGGGIGSMLGGGGGNILGALEQAIGGGIGNMLGAAQLSGLENLAGGGLDALLGGGLANLGGGLGGGALGALMESVGGGDMNPLEALGLGQFGGAGNVLDQLMDLGSGSGMLDVAEAAGSIFGAPGLDDFAQALAGVGLDTGGLNDLGDLVQNLAGGQAGQLVDQLAGSGGLNSFLGGLGASDASAFVDQFVGGGAGTAVGSGINSLMDRLDGDGTQALLGKLAQTGGLEQTLSNMDPGDMASLITKMVAPQAPPEARSFNDLLEDAIPGYGGGGPTYTDIGIRQPQDDLIDLLGTTVGPDVHDDVLGLEPQLVTSPGIVADPPTVDEVLSYEQQDPAFDDVMNQPSYDADPMVDPMAPAEASYMEEEQSDFAQEVDAIEETAESFDDQMFGQDG